MKPLSEMNVIDNYLATVSMGHQQFGKEITGIILKPIIGRDVMISEAVVESPIFAADPKKHGVRLDAYVTEDNNKTEVGYGNIYDLEPDQKSGEKEILPLRSRFYHSMIDKRTLDAGDSYKNLPSAWVIFILTYDPFGKDRMLYTIRNKCIEEPEMEYNDRSTTLYLYVNGKNTENCSRELQELLQYIKESTQENACNPDLKKLHTYITNIKSEASTQEGYIMWSAFIESERTEAAEEANKRADAEKNRADAEKNRADTEKNRADTEKNRADAAESEILELRAEISRLKRNGYGSN